MNQTSLKEYCKKLDRGEFPVGRGFIYQHEDIKLAWLFQAMQTMAIDYLAYLQIFDENLLETFAPVWKALDDRGWISIGDTSIRFKGAGQYYIPMIQSLIASKRLEQIRGGTTRRPGLKDIPIAIV